MYFLQTPVIVPNVREWLPSRFKWSPSLVVGGEGHDTYSMKSGTQHHYWNGRFGPEGLLIDIKLLESIRSTSDPIVLATLIEAAVWPELERALNYGLSYGIDEIIVDSDELAPIAPTITSLRFGPLLDGGLFFRDGRFVFEGRLTINGSLAD